MNQESQGDVGFNTRLDTETMEKLRALMAETGFNRRGKVDNRGFMEAIANSEYLDTGDRVILTFKKNT